MKITPDAGKWSIEWSVVETYATTAPWKVRDPFGLKEEENLELTVQGIYLNPRKSKNEAATALQNTDNTSSELEGTRVVNEDQAYLQNKFGPMSRTKSEQELLSNVTAEAVYRSTFGQIRFDKDNIVKYDGQFDEEHFRVPKVDGRSLQKPMEDFENIRNIGTSHKAENHTKATYPVGNEFEAAVYNTKIREQVSNAGSTEPEAEPAAFKTKMRKQVSNAGPAKPEAEPAAYKTKMREEGVSKLDSGYPIGVQKEKIKETDAEEDVRPFYEGGSRHVSSAPSLKTAAEFIKLMKFKEKQEKEAADLTLKVAGKSIKVPQSSVVVEPKEHIPKYYKQFNWHETTHADAWIYLRKNICFQNEFLVALNKPLGLPMHTPTASCRHTVIDFLKEFAEHCRVNEIFPCHRLDKDTTGVLLLAKSEKAAAAIKTKFANRSIIKQYFAIVKNCPPMREGTIKIPIGEGKIPNSEAFRAVLKPDLEKFNIRSMQKDCTEAVTWFKVLKSQRYAAFVEARPETGLTHQIRVHLAHGLSCPILGDHKYSHRDKMAPQRLHTEMLERLNVKQSKVRHLPLHLHCSKLEFTMPDGFMSKNFHEPIFVHARLPHFFAHTLKNLGLK
ncbi:unnamed protein product [Allacma fusca]|uniref:Pseudouridylate synthase RPUSD4, mitochondrial n=1 Tax=Allacma fusca TaxID=39272 RepID=A0A8J2KA59_9HEXA|nr:unnamed protein product [Allacma fusca]